MIKVSLIYPNAGARDSTTTTIATSTCHLSRSGWVRA